MPYRIIQSAACLGLTASPIRVEVDLANGLPQFNIVGLPDASVRESCVRVRSAIKNSGYRFPSDKVTINLAPADIRKEGPAFDLPIAVGVLAAMDIIPEVNLAQFIFIGELALDGSLRPMKGSLIVSSSLKEMYTFILPQQNADEASIEKKAAIVPVKNLCEVIDHLTGKQKIPLYVPPTTRLHKNFNDSSEQFDFSEIRGQSMAKRAIEIAVAGGHNILLFGPPGSGKTMLASRIPSILPPLDFEASLEITKIHSTTQYFKTENRLISTPPFQAPHHSISMVAMTGGGTWPKPGAVSLSHGGVLFLDELPEFRRDVLESLRSPIENGRILISRSKVAIDYPSRFMLVAAMNPCPCGFLTDPKRACRCTNAQIQKYQLKISGPILDRIDLHVEVAPISLEQIQGRDAGDSSASIQERIMACRFIQKDRFKEADAKLNALMRPRDIKKWVPLNEESKHLIEMAMKELHLSARAYFKILKIARTIADLADTDEISAEHIAEAIQYRTLDRQWWG